MNGHTIVFHPKTGEPITKKIFVIDTISSLIAVILLFYLAKQSKNFGYAQVCFITILTRFIDNIFSC